MPTSEEKTCWRAHGSYSLRLASKTSLIEETRQFLLTYARLRDIEATCQSLVNGGLPHRSRATRTTIAAILQIRLTRWHPPCTGYLDHPFKKSIGDRERSPSLLANPGGWVYNQTLSIAYSCLNTDIFT
jgi:hypothetical protein